QFYHGELADEHGACLVEFLQNRGVVVEYLAGVGARAPGGWLSSGAQEIFRAEGNALQWPAGTLALEFFVYVLRALDGGAGEWKRQCVVARSKLLEPTGEGVNQLDDRELASLQPVIQLSDGCEKDGVGEVGHQALN